MQRDRAADVKKLPINHTTISNILLNSYVQILIYVYTLLKNIGYLTYNTFLAFGSDYFIACVLWLTLSMRLGLAVCLFLGKSS